MLLDYDDSDECICGSCEQICHMRGKIVGDCFDYKRGSKMVQVNGMCFWSLNSEWFPEELGNVKRFGNVKNENYEK